MTVCRCFDEQIAVAMVKTSWFRLRLAEKYRNFRTRRTEHSLPGVPQKGPGPHGPYGPLHKQPTNQTAQVNPVRIKKTTNTQKEQARAAL